MSLFSTSSSKFPPDFGSQGSVTSTSLDVDAFYSIFGFFFFVLSLSPLGADSILGELADTFGPTGPSDVFFLSERFSVI